MESASITVKLVRPGAMTRIQTTGWMVVAATVLTQAAQAGLLIYGFGAIAPSLEAEFSAPRASIMLAATCLSLATSFAAPIAGAAVDARSIKGLMLAGAAMLALGFALLSQAEALWQAWLIFAVILPFANLLLGQLTSATLVTRWFDARRGRAMGISTLGTSLGGLVFPLLLAVGIEAWGWRTALAVIGIGTAAPIAFAVALLVTDRPSPEVLPERAAIAWANAPQTGAAEILGTTAFWIITVAIGVKIATYIALVGNLVPFAIGHGVGRIEAAGLLSAMSVASMTGKLGFGLIAERISLKALLTGALIMTIVSFAVLSRVETYSAMFAACLLMGLATGGMLPLWGLLAGRYFGPASCARALGLTNAAMVPLTASAAPLAGWGFDRTGSYDAGFLGAIVALAVALLLVGFLREPSRLKAATA